MTSSAHCAVESLVVTQQPPLPMTLTLSSLIPSSSSRPTRSPRPPTLPLQCPLLRPLPPLSPPSSTTNLLLPRPNQRALSLLAWSFPPRPCPLLPNRPLPPIRPLTLLLPRALYILPLALLLPLPRHPPSSLRRVEALAKSLMLPSSLLFLPRPLKRPRAPTLLPEAEEEDEELL